MAGLSRQRPLTLSTALAGSVCIMNLFLQANAFSNPAAPHVMGIFGVRKQAAGLLSNLRPKQFCFKLPFGQRKLAVISHEERQLSTIAASSTLSAAESNKLPAYSGFGKIKIKGLDFSIPVGSMFILAVFGWVILFYPPLLVAYTYSMLFDKKRRRAVDWIVHLWAKMAMLSVTFKPRVYGLENLPPASEAVMYIPNHCSYLDICTLSGFLPRPFKYVSKIEVLKIPFIGWAMRFAGHIAIERMDKRSQLQTFKDTVQILQDGNSVVTFAEGTRSKDGRLCAFKKGPIKMAIKAGVRIVPVSISNLHRWMPDTALCPLAIPRGVEVRVHPPVDPAGRNEDQVLTEVFNAVNSGLPEGQRSLPSSVAGAGE